MALRLDWRGATTLPVDGSPIAPAAFRGLPAAAAARQSLRLGNGRCELGELFRVTDAPTSFDDDRLTVAGDLSHVYGLGRGMAGGTLVVDGEAGAEVGAGMTGGRIEVNGPAGPWAGAEMRGGLLAISGDAGDHLGAAYPGSRRGMRGGAILARGRAGDDVGQLLRRGLIAVRGDVGEGLGRGMIAGTIVALGGAGRRLGAGMKRGTLLLPSAWPEVEDCFPPTFAPAGTWAQPYVALILGHLRELGFGFREGKSMSAVAAARYNGDLAVGGRGEILAGTVNLR